MAFKVKIEDQVTQEICLKDAAPGLWISVGSTYTSVLLVMDKGWTLLSSTNPFDEKALQTWTSRWECNLKVRPFKGNIILSA